MTARITFSDRQTEQLKIDTGASGMTVSKDLAEDLGLDPEPTSKRSYGLGGCSSQHSTARVADWTWDNDELPATDVAVLDVEDFGEAHGQPIVGIIGSDILERYGVLHIDFDAGRVAAGEQTPREQGESEPVELRMNGSGSGKPPLLAPVTINDTTVQLMPDTGAAITTIDSDTATAAKVELSEEKVTMRGSGCTVTGTVSRPIESWAVGNIELPAQEVAVFEPVVRPAGIEPLRGVIGMDALSTYDSVTFDYQERTITLRG